jgi:predicted secreted protein
MNKFRAKIIPLQLQLIILMIFSVAASAQSTRELKEIFSQAESYYLYEEYDLANQLYILLDTPDNLNIKYKIGTC